MHNGNIKHARALGFGYRNLLAIYVIMYFDFKGHFWVMSSAFIGLWPVYCFLSGDCRSYALLGCFFFFFFFRFSFARFSESGNGKASLVIFGSI